MGSYMWSAGLYMSDLLEAVEDSTWEDCRTGAPSGPMPGPGPGPATGAAPGSATIPVAIVFFAPIMPTLRRTDLSPVCFLAFVEAVASSVPGGAPGAEPGSPAAPRLELEGSAAALSAQGEGHLLPASQRPLPLHFQRLPFLPCSSQPSRPASAAAGAILVAPSE